MKGLTPVCHKRAPLFSKKNKAAILQKVFLSIAKAVPECKDTARGSSGGRFVMLGGIVTCEIVFPAVLTLCVRRQNKSDGSFYECIPSLPQIFHCVVAEQLWREKLSRTERSTILPKPTPVVL